MGIDVRKELGGGAADSMAASLGRWCRRGYGWNEGAGQAVVWGRGGQGGWSSCRILRKDLTWHVGGMAGRPVYLRQRK